MFRGEHWKAAKEDSVGCRERIYTRKRTYTSDFPIQQFIEKNIGVTLIRHMTARIGVSCDCSR